VYAWICKAVLRQWLSRVSLQPLLNTALIFTNLLQLVVEIEQALNCFLMYHVNINKCMAKFFSFFYVNSLVRLIRFFWLDMSAKSISAVILLISTVHYYYSEYHSFQYKEIVPCLAAVERSYTSLMQKHTAIEKQ